MRPIKQIAILAVLVSACGGGGGNGGNSGTLTEPPLNLSGRWRGPISDSSDPPPGGRITWRVTQAGASVSGTFKATGNTGRVEGTVSGTLNGTNLQYTMTVPMGGFEAFPTCTAAATGQATVSADRIQGAFTATNSCFGSVTDGQLDLIRL